MLMMSGELPVLDRSARRAGPARHSPLAGWSWGLLALAADLYCIWMIGAPLLANLFYLNRARE